MNLSGVDFKRSNFECADHSDSTISKSNFIDANLRNIRLNGRKVDALLEDASGAVSRFAWMARDFVSKHLLPEPHIQAKIRAERLSLRKELL